MRNRILGIAGLMIRQAIRSRFVLSLVVLMLALLTSFALTIKGDGTAAGRLQMLLTYAMGSVGVVLGIATLWLACGSLSIEIENRRIHLVVVKPVRTIELWLGKWLGIISVAMLLLLVAGLFLAAAGRIARVRSHPDSRDGRALRDRILVARHAVKATRVGSSDGASHWQLACPAAVAPQGVATLRYRFVAPLRDMPPVTGHWILRGPDGATLFEADCSASMDGVNRLDIPLATLRPATPLDLSFHLQPGGEGTPQHVTFHPRHDVTLLLPTGTFAGNLTRALLLMFCQLALLAALGITAGTIFTFPVAMFAASALVLATLFAQFFVFSSTLERSRAHAHHHHAAAAHAWTETLGEHLAVGLRFAMAPTLRYRINGRLAAGETIPWTEVHDCAGILILGYSGLLCALGCLMLNRREIALPV